MAALLALVLPRAAASAEQPPAEGAQISAARIHTPIKIDGLLDEPEWSSASAAARFLQRDPNEGAPPTEATELRVLVDDGAVYVGVRLRDSDAATIGRRLSRRDEQPDADAIQLYLDPRGDRRSGAMFDVTAAGVQRDALIFNDSGLDFSWDAVWDSAVTVDARGWTAEMRIPLSQLRFPSEHAHAWGINVARYLRRRNETDWLFLVPKDESHLAARMGRLTGVEGIRPAPRLEIVPHVVARNVSGVETSASSDPPVGGFGVDAKAALGANLTIDATVNPDFAQLESEPASINLTAFETFFDERRPFFTDSAPLFQTFGNSGATSHPSPINRWT